MVDPITIIVTALATGAAAGLKPTAAQAVKDAYAGLKSLIQRKLGTTASVDALESKPDSETKQSSVAEDLADTGGEVGRHPAWELPGLVLGPILLLEDDGDAGAPVEVEAEDQLLARLVGHGCAVGLGFKVVIYAPCEVYEVSVVLLVEGLRV